MTKLPLSFGRDDVEDLDLYGNSNSFEDLPGESYPRL
jgi:hypothetical protein